jgi:hypothetical protein
LTGERLSASFQERRDPSQVALADGAGHVRIARANRECDLAVFGDGEGVDLWGLASTREEVSASDGSRSPAMRMP